MVIKLTAEQLQYMAMYESMSGASVIDCVLPEKSNRVVFVVKRGNISMAIGKGGMNVKRARDRFGRDIEIIEYNDDPKEFITKLASPARIQGIRIVEGSGKKTAYVNVHPQDRGIAIGKEGNTINKIKELTKRHHQIDNVVIV
jgi:N utilization substance protein A